MQKKTSTLCKGVAMAALISLPSFMSAQETKVIFSENFGTPTSEKDEAVTDHVWNNSSTMYSWSNAEDINVRNNKPSEGYEGASGDGNLYFNEKPVSFTISGINTQGYGKIILSFGIFGKDAGAAKQMIISYRDNNGDSIFIADTKDLGLAAAKGTWELISSGLSLPASSNLSISFASYEGDAKAEIRIDDVIIKGTQTASGITATEATVNIYADGQTLRLEGISPTDFVSVYSISGNKVLEVPAAATIQTNLPQGIYLVKAGQKITRVVIR